MTAPSSRGWGLIWAVVGGAVLFAAILAVVVAATTSGPRPSPTGPAPSSATSAPANPLATGTSSPSATAIGGYVDDEVERNGWTPEPITTDRERYIRAALAAAATFDTQSATRDEWLRFLDTWFTPDTRYAESDRATELEAARLELRQSVALPESEWDSLAEESGRVAAGVDGEITYVLVPDDDSGDMSIGTADVVLTLTRSDGGSGELSYDETVRVSVQVLCGAGSVPTPNSAQQAGDCKVVRYFSEPLEP